MTEVAEYLLKDANAEWAVSGLLQALKDPDSVVREAAAYRLKSLREELPSNTCFSAKVAEALSKL